MAKKKKAPTEYEKLRAVWYDKLKAEGFDDIEQDEDNLKVWSAVFTRKKFVNTWKEREAYYSMATNFLNDYKFKNKTEQIIWEYHTNGISTRDISKLLKDTKVVDIPYYEVWKTIKRLVKEMKTLYVYNDYC